jgi:hypothetical protein
VRLFWEQHESHFLCPSLLFCLKSLILEFAEWLRGKQPGARWSRASWLEAIHWLKKTPIPHGDPQQITKSTGKGSKPLSSFMTHLELLWPIVSPKVLGRSPGTSLTALVAQCCWEPFGGGEWQPLGGHVGRRGSSEHSLCRNSLVHFMNSKNNFLRNTTFSKWQNLSGEERTKRRLNKDPSNLQLLKDLLEFRTPCF